MAVVTMAPQQGVPVTFRPGTRPATQGGFTMPTILNTPPINPGSFAYTGANANQYGETTRTGTAQAPTNVLNVLNTLRDSIGNYGTAAGNLYNAGQSLNLPSVNLNSNFAGPEQLKAAMGGGIDYFGQQGIAAGLQNLALQDAARQRQLASGLGQNAGNQSLLNVLRSQGALQMGLAQQPLYAEAQQGTLERAMNNINLQNQNIQNQNQTMLGQAGFNTQNQLAGLQARTAALQPYQNLLETLTNLQGQGRGVNTVESAFGQKNYK